MSTKDDEDDNSQHHHHDLHVYMCLYRRIVQQQFQIVVWEEGRRNDQQEKATFKMRCDYGWKNVKIIISYVWK